MNEAQFWQLIELTYQNNSDDHDRRLKQELIELSLNDVLAFAKFYYEFYFAAYRWDLWRIAYVILGGCSDDCFMDFRAMMIRRGEAFYRDMLTDPQAVALRGEVSEEEFLGSFGYCIEAAYEQLSGGQLPLEALGAVPENPVGERWNDDELAELFPALCAKFDFSE